MKKIILIACVLAFSIGCADQVKRQKYLQSQYPSCKIEPATGIIQNAGYEFLVIDSTGQMVAVQFYQFSETKILSLKNVR